MSALPLTTDFQPPSFRVLPVDHTTLGTGEREGSRRRGPCERPVLCASVAVSS